MESIQTELAVLLDVAIAASLSGVIGIEREKLKNQQDYVPILL